MFSAHACLVHVSESDGAVQDQGGLLLGCKVVGFGI